MSDLTVTALLVTGDAALATRVQELSAAAGVTTVVVPSPTDAGRAWAEAAVVLLGADVLVDVLPGRRDGLVLVAGAGDPDLWHRAGVLGAAAVHVLPGGESALVELLMAAHAGPGPFGHVVGMLGAVGGSGASTLAVALAAASPPGTALLVDADPAGSGLTLAVGAEDEPGLRWDDLTTVRGALRPDVLSRALPVADGVRLLGWGGRLSDGSGRPGTLADGLLPLEALRSVATAARAVQELMVVDLPRRCDAAAAQHWRLLDAAVVVVPARVRAVVAAREVLAGVAAVTSQVHVVVRAEGRGALGSDAVSDALGWPVTARWSCTPRLMEAGERGDLVHAARAGSTSRLARELLERLGEGRPAAGAGR